MKNKNGFDDSAPVDPESGEPETEQVDEKQPDDFFEDEKDGFSDEELTDSDNGAEELSEEKLYELTEYPKGSITEPYLTEKETPWEIQVHLKNVEGASFYNYSTEEHAKEAHNKFVNEVLS